MGIAVLDAVTLAKQNKRQHEKLLERHQLLQQRCVRESRAQGMERRVCQNNALAPFRDIFLRLKNVELAELLTFEGLWAGAMPDVEVTHVRLSATGALGALMGGAATGAAAGVATIAAVGALATASTGTAISGLSGAVPPAPRRPGWAAGRSRRAAGAWRPASPF